MGPDLSQSRQDQWKKLVIEHFLLELRLSTRTVHNPQLKPRKYSQLPLRLVKTVSAFQYPSREIVVLYHQQFLLVAVRQQFLNYLCVLPQNCVIVPKTQHLQHLQV